MENYHLCCSDVPLADTIPQQDQEAALIEHTPEPFTMLEDEQLALFSEVVTMIYQITTQEARCHHVAQRTLEQRMDELHNADQQRSRRLRGSLPKSSPNNNASMNNFKPSSRLAGPYAFTAAPSATVPCLSDMTSPELQSGQGAYCYEPGTTGYLVPPLEPLPPSPHCGLSLSPLSWLRLSYSPRHNILALANIAPVVIFLRLTWSLVGQGPPACFLTVACLPHFTLCYVYCLPRCFLTVCVSASLYSVLCFLLTSLFPYCLRVCLALPVEERRGLSRIGCFLRCDD